MGGEETGVTDSTKNILLEAAYFLPASIRRTAREFESAERRKLSVRARRRSGNGFARVAARN